MPAGGHLPTGSALEDDGHQVPTAPVPLPHSKITTSAHDTWLPPDTSPLSWGLMTCQESGEDEFRQFQGTNLCKTSEWPQGEKCLQNLVCAASCGHPNKTSVMYSPNKTSIMCSPNLLPKEQFLLHRSLWQKQDLTKSWRQTGSSSPK